MTSKVSAQVSN